MGPVDRHQLRHHGVVIGEAFRLVEVGRDFHLQVKISAVDHNNVVPWEGKGNTLADSRAGCALVRDGRRRRDPRLDRQPVSSPAQPAGRLRVRDHRRDLRRHDLVGRGHVAQLLPVPLPGEHFKYASIGAPNSGIPHRIWRALPRLFPERFGGREDYSAIDPNSGLGARIPHRLDFSYTERFRAYQLAEFFKGTPYQFRRFEKTDGYANLPLDGLWLRAPYLHNGAAPTLADLLEPPERRPQTFLRGGDVLDTARGGFLAPPCDPSAPQPPGRICFDTRLPGNGNGGHLYGADLPSAEEAPTSWPIPPTF